MGTEVQSEMYMPCYYSLRDLNDNTGNGSWSLHQQNSMLGIGQYHDFCLTRPAIDVNDHSDREQLRQTILTHESVFRHQLHELHRLYRIQRDMMNEMRSKELHRHTMQRGTPQFSFCSSGIPAVDDNGRQHTSNLFLNHGRVSLSDTDSIQCEFRSTEENILQSSYGPTQNELRLKDCEMSESECKKLRRRLFDLELPADAYMNDEEEGPGLSGVSAAESYLLSRSHAMTRDRDGNLSIHTGVNSGCIGDVPNMRYPHGWWRNLNEPIKLKEASSSALTDVLGNNICSKEEMERQVLSSNSNTSFQCLSKFSQDSPKVREIGVSLNSLLLETQRRQKGLLANNTEAGQIGSNGRSLFESFHSGDLPATSKSQQTEPRNSNELVKKKLFGVEICDRNHDASVEDSRMRIRHSFFPQSNVENSESSLFSSWKKIHSEVSQDMAMVQGNPSFSSFTPSNKSSVAEMESTEGIQNKLLVCSNLRSIPSISAEASSRTHLCHSSPLESKESCVCYSLNGFSHLNPNGSSNDSSASEKLTQDGPNNSSRHLGSMMDAKFSDQKKADAVISSNGYQNEGISQCAAVSANESRKQSSQTILPWLKAVPSCNGCSFEERQGSSQMNLDSLRSSFQHFVDKTEMMRKSSFQSYVQDSSSATCALDAEHQRTEVGECSSSRKILGCSIFEKAPISMDHPSPSNPAKPSPAAVVDDTNPLKDGPHNTKAPGELSPKLGERREAESWIEKGLINLSSDSICHIDLNKSVIDEGFGEETEPTTCSCSRNNLKTSVEIDLEAPVVDETELDVAPGFESFRSKLPPGYESSQSKHASSLESVQRKLPPDFESFQSKHPSRSESTQSKHPSRSESTQSKLPPGFESFQSKRLPDSESVQSNRPHGFESFPSKHCPRSESVQSKLPPGFESFESKRPLGSESVRSNLPPGFESVQSKHPSGSKSVQSNLPPGFESFQGKCSPGSKSVRSNLPPGFESFQSKHPSASESLESELPRGFEPLHSELPPGFESLQCKLKEPGDRLQDQSGEPHGLIAAAAQALVAISSSRIPLQVDNFCHQSEASPGDPLHWFADVISSYKGDIQNEIESVSMGKNSVHEDILPDGMDYFEYMTLSLTEAKVEEIGTYRPQVFENSKNENILLKRPRRGQARRGRQRKDFQRDVLPTLSSLLKNEVSEDLQTIEGLIQATGGTWRSSLALKNTRSGGGRRKRRVPDSDGLPNATETQLSNCREVAIEDHTNLFGWGKRTRRPPRQRYPITNPLLAIK